jgi:hypothetical protein
MSPIHSHSFKIHFNIIHRSIPTSSEWSPLFRLTNQQFLLISYLLHALTISACLLLLELVILTTFGEEYKLRS